MLHLLGIHPNRLFMVIAGIGVLVIGLVIHGTFLMAIGGLLIVWSAVTFVASRRRRSE
jgi:hypothetical protein